MSQDSAAQNRVASAGTHDPLERGIVDLYARRMHAVSAKRAIERQAALEDLVVTKPFGRPFTAQPSHPPESADLDTDRPGGLAGLRRKLAGAVTPTRKLATS